MNRAIRTWDLNAIYVIGPGHGRPAAVANAYLEGTYTEVYSLAAKMPVHSEGLEVVASVQVTYALVSR
jgi:phosphoketolase